MTTKAQLQEIYIGLLGRAADPAGLQYWADEVDNGVLTIAQVRENIVNDQPEYEEMYEGKNREEVVTQLYINLFGRSPEDAGLEYWVEGEGAEVTIDDLIFALSDGAGTSDRQALDNRVEVAQYYTDNAADFDKEESAGLIAGVDANPATVEDAKNAIGGGEQPSIPGETYVLTDGRDVITGTDNDDLFDGLVGQNQNGAIANALSTGDRLDGGAGRDRLEATMLNDNETDATNLLGGQAPRPITSNIEEVSIEALESVNLDATRMEGVEEFWSEFSRGNLTIDNVNLRGSNVNNTNDITFGLKDADGGAPFTPGAGLAAYFESQALVRPEASQINSQLLIRIADVSTETPDTPLENVSVNLGFSLGDVEYELEDVRSTDGTYAGLVNAIKNALVAEGLPGVNVQLSTPYNEVTFAGNTVTLPFVAQEILLTDPAGQAFDSVTFTQSAIEAVQDGFLVAGNAAPVDPSVVSNLIETNLVLDNAGRGSVAGDVVIGGGSNSGRGIEKFNVTVDRDSAIASLNTTYGLLQEVDIASAADANGSLYIGETQAGLSEIDANGFAGANLQLGGNKAMFFGDAIENLAFLNAAETTANVTFVGENSSGLAASLQTGSGNDFISLEQEGVSASGSTPTQVSIDAGDGDNVVIVDSTNEIVDVDPVNIATVVTGSGNDVVRGTGNHLTASTGAGNDVIYAENTGDFAEASMDAGEFNVFHTVSTRTDIPEWQLLHNRDVRVTLALPGDDAVYNTTGLEVVVNVKASNGILTTERDLYEAVANAINENAILGNLAEAYVDSNGDLYVDYLIDGEFAAATNAVEIQVRGSWADTSFTATQQTNLINALKEFYQDSSIANADVATAYDAAGKTALVEVDTDGSYSDTSGVNYVNAGQGNDLVVLSSNETTTDTVAFDAGSFGKTTIVHFTDGAAAGFDVLDFSAWLDNETSPSGSAVSRERVEVELNTAAGAINANDVTVVDFNLLGTAGGVTFGNVTGDNILAAFNEAGGWTVAQTTGLVGNAQKSILLVHNDAASGNDGVYKAFQVTSTNEAGENFTSVSLIGTLDFGAEQTFDVANFA